MNDVADRHTLELRRAGPADGALLSEVAARLFEQTFGSANTVEDMRAFLATTYTVERQTAELADPDRVTWILEASDGSATDPTALGFATLRRGTRSDGVLGDRPAEVQRLYADRALHGRGVGARLMDTCIAQARAWECDVIWLAVWEKNPRAIAFYEKKEFRRVGRQTFQLGSDIQHDHVMARNLSSPG